MAKLLTAAGAAVLAAVWGCLLLVAGSAVTGRLAWAADSVLVGAGMGAAVLAGVAVHGLWPRRHRLLPSLLAAAAASASVVGAVGVSNVTAMFAGVEASCAVGVGHCEATGRAKMPLLLDSGPVQTRPVVRVILWGVDPAERSVVERTEAAAPALGQPLLEDYYGVHAATDGGAWTAPGDPRKWMSSHHREALFPSDLSNLIDAARGAEHWPDTPDTQYWLATDLTGPEVGTATGACADHIHVPGVVGSLVRLPLGTCRLPAPRTDLATDTACRPLAVVQPAMNAPQTIEAGIAIFIGHEFAETATDPTHGWTVLVAARCNGDPLLEIADVCEPDGSFISAPAWHTQAGWQPSLLEPPGPGRTARCVNPASPDPPRRTETVGQPGR